MHLLISIINFFGTDLHLISFQVSLETKQMWAETQQ